MSDSQLMLSGYPEPKIRLACSSCTRKGQYDVQAMLEAGGDRRLLDLLDDFKERAGCPNHPGEPRISQYCRLHYANLAEHVRRGNAYAKSKGG